MADFTYQLADDSKTVELVFNSLDEPLPDLTQLKNRFKATEFASFHLKEDNLKEAIESVSDLATDGESSGKKLVFEVAKKRGSTVTVEVADSKMEAFVFIVTAEGGVNPTKDEIMAQLNKSKVTFGIDEKVIDNLVAQFDRVAPGTEFREVVAKGEPPGESEPYTFQNLVTPFEERVLEPQTNEDGSIDMNNLGEIVTVESGTELVRRVKGKTGANGHNVYNEIISAKIPEKPDFGIGDGTVISQKDPDVLVASIDGVPLKKHRGMRISDALIVKDVDIKVGNIDYDGNVLIKGNVNPGMSVKARGDIIIDGYVESATITAMGDIIVKQGVIGRPSPTDFPDHGSAKEGLTVKLMALGNISAMYAQYAFIHAKEDVSFSSQLLNSFVIAKNKVQVGMDGSRRSRLVGGHIFAGRCVQSGIIGSNSFVSTHINLGDDIPIAEKVLSNLKQEINKLTGIKNKLDNDIETLQKKTVTAELESKMIEIAEKRSKVEEKLNSLTEKKILGDKQLGKKKEAIRVDCWANLFPGSYVTIGDYSFKAETQYGFGAVVFSDSKLVFTK